MTDFSNASASGPVATSVLQALNAEQEKLFNDLYANTRNQSSENGVFVKYNSDEIALMQGQNDGLINGDNKNINNELSSDNSSLNDKISAFHKQRLLAEEELCKNDSECSDTYPEFPTMLTDEATGIRVSDELRTIGNIHFKNSRYLLAQEKYRKSCQWLEPFLPSAEVEACLVSALLNLILCKSRLGDFEGAIVIASQVLEIEPMNIKALYRRGQVYINMHTNVSNQLSGSSPPTSTRHWLDSARRDLSQALEQAPTDSLIRNEIKRLKAEESLLNKKNKELMLQGLYSDVASHGLPRVFFDITLNNHHIGRIVFELFIHIVPKTCENFRLLCNGTCGVGKQTGALLHYKGTEFHRVSPGNCIQGGDIERGQFGKKIGKGGESIYGGYFEDENFRIKHSDPGIVSMTSNGPNTNNSQFFITTAAAPWLNDLHVAFGRVIEGMSVVRILEDMPYDGLDGEPFSLAKVDNCGELPK